jgi:hypothetical protein
VRVQLWRIFHTEDTQNLYRLLCVVRVVESRMGKQRIIQNFAEKPRKFLLGRSRRWDIKMKMNVR